MEKTHFFLWILFKQQLMTGRGGYYITAKGCRCLFYQTVTEHGIMKVG